MFSCAVRLGNTSHSGRFYLSTTAGTYSRASSSTRLPWETLSHSASTSRHNDHPQSKSSKSNLLDSKTRRKESENLSWSASRILSQSTRELPPPNDFEPRDKVQSPSHRSFSQIPQNPTSWKPPSAAIWSHSRSARISRSPFVKRPPRRVDGFRHPPALLGTSAARRMIREVLSEHPVIGLHNGQIYDEILKRFPNAKETELRRKVPIPLNREGSTVSQPRDIQHPIRSRNHLKELLAALEDEKFTEVVMLRYGTRKEGCEYDDLSVKGRGSTGRTRIPPNDWLRSTDGIVWRIRLANGEEQDKKWALLAELDKEGTLIGEY